MTKCVGRCESSIRIRAQLGSTFRIPQLAGLRFESVKGKAEVKNYLV